MAVAVLFCSSAAAAVVKCNHRIIINNINSRITIDNHDKTKRRNRVRIWIKIGTRIETMITTI